MKIFSTKYIPAVIIFLACSCGDDSFSRYEYDDAKAKGSFSLNVTAKVDIKENKSRNDGLSRLTDKQREVLENIASNPGENFRMEFYDGNGALHKSWDKVNDFSEEELFPIGRYSLNIYHGDSETEDFDTPHIFGGENVTIEQDMTKSVTVTAQLRSSLVGIDCTDDFVSIFDSYTATLHTASENSIYFGYDSSGNPESRIAYIQPGEAAVNLTVNKDGKVASSEILTFTATQAGLQKFRLDAVDNKGDVSLKVTFVDTDSVIDIPIDLTGAFTEAPVPVVQNHHGDFMPIMIFQGNDNVTDEENAYVFDIAAQGAMKEVVLTIEADGVAEQSYDLLSQLPDGVKALGINRNSMFGRVDITGWIKNISTSLKGDKEKKYRVSLKVTDKLNQTSEVGDDNVINVTYRPESSELILDPSQFDDGVGEQIVDPENFYLLLNTTIDNLSTNRIFLTTSYMGLDENVDFEIVETEKNEVPDIFDTAPDFKQYQYRLKVVTPGKLLTFPLKGISNQGVALGEELTITREVPILDCDEEKDILAHSDNVEITLHLRDWQKDFVLFTNILLEGKLSFTLIGDQFEKSIVMTPSNYNRDRNEVKIYFEGLEEDTPYSLTGMYGHRVQENYPLRTSKKLPRIKLNSADYEWWTSYALVHISLEEETQKNIEDFATMLQSGDVEYGVSTIDGATVIESTPIVNSSFNGGVIDLVVKGAQLKPNTTYTLFVKNSTEQNLELNFTTESGDALPVIDFGDESAVWGTNNTMTTQYGNGNINGAEGTQRVSDDGRNVILLRTLGWGSTNDAEKYTQNLFQTRYRWYCNYTDAALLHIGTGRDVRDAGNTSKEGNLSTDALSTGVDFPSRPTSLTFNYKYVARNAADYGFVEIQLMSGGDKIATANMNLTSTSNSYQKATVTFNYSDKSKKADSLYVKFLSTNSTDRLSISEPSGQSSSSYNNDSNFTFPTNENKGSTSYVGSSLYLDDVKLGYEVPADL